MRPLRKPGRHEVARESLRAGKGDYLDLLDAQRTLVEARELHVESLALYHQAVADVEGLIGEALQPASTRDTQPKGAKDEPQE